MSEIVDSHCHLDYYPDVDAVIARAKENGVTRMATIGTQIDDFAKLHAICEQHRECCYMTIGVHPDNVDNLGIDAFEQAFCNINDDFVIGVGEIGLDYKDNPDAAVKQKQRIAFECQLQLAGNKPVYIHTRDAIEDTLSVVGQFPHVRGVFHCFSENVDIARRVLDLGFLISLSGIVTFKNAPTVHDVARYVPLDRLLVETDSPFLAPVPHRGKQNEPAYTRMVAERIAQLKGCAPEVIVAQTSDNFDKLFGVFANRYQGVCGPDA
jgi:TatD DNase family protein